MRQAGRNRKEAGLGEVAFTKSKPSFQDPIHFYGNMQTCARDVSGTDPHGPVEAVRAYMKGKKNVLSCQGSFCR